MICIEDIKNLTPEERVNVFAKLNNKDLELVMHHASIELQDRELAKETANSRLIWKDKQ